ncbi:hypothetical protein BV20DRAFT_640515 [Pilatotrama ljubarskyi]|nr:hypothetical protein BV20DRAFT_640515 [Pilatotrama ljubarskyi]
MLPPRVSTHRPVSRATAAHPLRLPLLSKRPVKHVTLSSALTAVMVRLGSCRCAGWAPARACRTSRSAYATFHIICEMDSISQSVAQDRRSTKRYCTPDVRDLEIP